MPTVKASNQTVRPLRRDYALRPLPAGTMLYHGTDCAGDFRRIEGPAWFASDPRVAAGWAGWATPPRGRTRGQKRVIRYRTDVALGLIDTSAEGEWRALSDELCRDPDAGIREVAAKVRSLLLDGWFGRAEIMISHAETDLVYLDEVPV